MFLEEVRVGKKMRGRCGLSPVEYLSPHWKQHELLNFCPTIFGRVSHYVCVGFCRMRRRPMTFWPQRGRVWTALLNREPDQISRFPGSVTAPFFPLKFFVRSQPSFRNAAASRPSIVVLCFPRY